jgi:hypothetical protein
MLEKRRSRVAQRDKTGNELVVDYTLLRTAVGLVTALLPFVLVISAAVNSEPWPQSLSGYYYTISRNVLVGALCGIGVFLVAYRGYDPLDRWIAVLAGVFAIGVAFFPTSHPSFSPRFIGYLHQFFATALMISLAVMALQFTRTVSSKGQSLGEQLRHLWNALCGKGKVSPTREDVEAAKEARAASDPDAAMAAGLEELPDPVERNLKRIRNRIYIFCSRLILVLIVVAFVQNFIPVHWHLFFFCEVALLETFAVSWFVKGQSLLFRDPAKPPIGNS